jgi:hypothetical protein
MHAFLIICLVLLTPVVLGLVLYFFGEEHPRSDEDDGEPALA